jgi:hypothetical protein
VQNIKQQLYYHVAQLTNEFNQFSTAQISAVLYSKTVRLLIVYLDMRETHIIHLKCIAPTWAMPSMAAILN